MSSSFQTQARPFLSIALFALCANAGAQTSVQAPASDPNAGRYVISYVCGDAQIDGTAPLPPDGRPYNLGVSFASAKTGQPIANVQVRLRRHGRVLVEFNATGSRCLFSVPEASYRIEGTYQGAEQFAIVETGALTTQLRW
ncbi:hypothetical protein [Burkholderia pseudomultivorans]|uniref:hypothetical protein n=1 Tax=Burkholderia pseudomultivorans TaxID=1207504 RepID=UPI00075B4284|nr:hypothetical protein [Burkholderia pseudomultivorans]KVC34271.1 hypothetical protein WS55_33970 [Burkholderia pseudomultivorans]KVC42550.1 hypothetical protein WS56_31500 [Burkholderia pseudomultivorans]KWF11795.1 hypothetical protein WT55_11960 [Burkholderia pseudomultivorans]MBF5013390.1 hypothetical protein [Burkholderia pseudomultivorans]MDS0858940.1 hypothetical protein [Burkholderia pseudomultivorans]